MECLIYNTFTKSNMKTPIPSQLYQQIAAPLTALASPQRVAILLAIGSGEACVCHLEAALGWRQAYLSQHLMALRKAEVLQDRREGRYVYYRLKDPLLLNLLLQAAALSGVSPDSAAALINLSAPVSCECPHCVPNAAPAENNPQPLGGRERKFQQKSESIP